MSTPSVPLLQRAADGLGIVGSITCAAHCLLMPVLLVSGTALPAAFVDEEFIHLVLLVVVIPSALIAFLLGCRRHRDRWVLGLGGLGMIALIAIVLAGHDLLGETQERVLMVAASSMLIAAHVRNYLLCRDCDHHH